MTDQDAGSDTGRESPSRAGYTSKLRAMQKERTGHLILAAVATILNRADLAAVTIAEVAQVAEVTDRTVYRHFSTREELLRAFWSWQLQQAAGERVTTPQTLPALLETVQRLFASLDSSEGVIRAMLASPEGRDIRLQTNRARHDHMLAFVEALLPELPAHERHSLASGIVVVSSVMSWMFMRDHCGYDGVRAGEAAAYAVQSMIEAAQRRSRPGEG